MSFQKDRAVFVCWSVKGGSGTSVVAALLSLALVRRGVETTLVDLQGDQPAILGRDGEASLGVRQWLQAGDRVAPEALGRLTTPVSDGLLLLPSGPSADHTPPAAAEVRATRLREALAGSTAVVDAGIADRKDSLTSALAGAADESLLVLRPCFLAVRRAAALTIPTTGIVVVEEPDRALDGGDLADVLGVPVVATVRWDPALARAVDAGRVLGRRARSVRSIDALAASLVAPAEEKHAS